MTGQVQAAQAQWDRAGHVQCRAVASRLRQARWGHQGSRFRDLQVDKKDDWWPSAELTGEEVWVRVRENQVHPSCSSDENKPSDQEIDQHDHLGGNELWNMWTVNFQMFKLVLEKAEEPEIKLPTSSGSSKKQRIPEKHLFLLSWLCQSLWLCGSQ